jgi:hypothetical protein
MSFQAKRELLAQTAARYQAAGHTQKTTILDEFVAATGYTRKYAIRVLRHPPPVAAAISRPRAPRYGPAVQAALRVAWEAANGICGKRLVPFLPELVPALERHGHLQLTDAVRMQLLALSPATADRLLAGARRAVGPRGIATTKPGALLKQQVPLRTFAGWDDAAPGFVEADLVAHCGSQAAGAFLHTLVLTDVATGWTECLPLLTRSHDAVIGALGQARQLLPFPLLGLDTDNGPEFLNYELLGYCEREAITFTRGRAYRKNDQCFVEQKNGVIVRQLVGYDRFESAAAYRQLGEVYRALRLYVNFFQPSMKLREKRRDGMALQRRYDRAQTPWQRLLASGVLDAASTARLTGIFQRLDPVRLRRQLETLLDALWRHAAFVSPISPAGAHLAPTPGPLVAFQHAACGTPAAAPLPPEPPDLGVTATGRRRYRQTHKYAGPRWWRTRADPFADVWDEVAARLAADPTRTAKGLFRELQAQHPGRFPDIQLRTLQRRVQQWRTTAILTFQDIWHDDDRLASASPVVAAD